MVQGLQQRFEAAEQAAAASMRAAVERVRASGVIQQRVEVRGGGACMRPAILSYRMQGWPSVFGSGAGPILMSLSLHADS